MAVRPTSFDARTEHNGRSLSQLIYVKSPRISIRCVLNLQAGAIAGWRGPVTDSVMTQTFGLVRMTWVYVDALNI